MSPLPDCASWLLLTFSFIYSRGPSSFSSSCQSVSAFACGMSERDQAEAAIEMSKQERDRFFTGREDENGKTVMRGLGNDAGTLLLIRLG